MELDTRSGVSIISENAYRDNLKHMPLKASHHQLRTYTGEVARPIGVAGVKVVYQDQTKTLPLYVLKGKGVNLFGREWLEHISLNWPLLALSSTPMGVQKVLSQHESVFHEGMGHLKSIKAHIHLEGNAQPRFFKACPVPLARKTLVEQALDNLEAKGIVQKVRHSDTAHQL